MMLVSPLPSASMFSSARNAEDSIHRLPAKDIEAFNSLLPPAVEFVEGSSSGLLAVAEGKYEAINASPKVTEAELPGTARTPATTPSKAPSTPTKPSGSKLQSLYPGTIDLTWSPTFNKGSGLFNTGNTCFMNSALQCLIHTPPLLRLLFSHTKEHCRAKSNFCMTCSLRLVATKSHGGKTPFNPTPISNNLHVIAKHLRKGRQEDSHEFLRYAIDALQKSCLAGYPPKLDTKLQETTWVHKLFGGRLRSRVSCRDCGHNSDTFDRILDLSLDIFKCDSLKDALRKFVAVDHLRGADKYKCEKCKKPVNADKQFTIHEAPPVLTVHLKRFSPLGRKIGHILSYPETLSLRPYMSEGQHGPTYSLYGVICHAGGGPNSGHYYAFVQSREGKWFEMNDESVSQTSLPIDKKSAYILFYIQKRGQGLEAAVSESMKTVVKNGGLAASMKKRTAKEKNSGEEDEEDKGVKVDGPVPNLPVVRPPLALKPSGPDPQALALRQKIANAKERPSALGVLANYASSDAEEKDDSDKDSAPEKKSEDVEMENASPSEPSEPPTPVKAPPTSPPPSSPQSVSTSSFYASVKSKKRKSPDDENHRPQHRAPGFSHSAGFNPFNSNALTYGKRRRRMAKGI